MTKNNLAELLTNSIGGNYRQLDLPAKVVVSYFLLMTDESELGTTVNAIIRFCGESGRLVYSGLYALRDSGLIDFPGDLVSGEYKIFKIGDKHENE